MGDEDDDYCSRNVLRNAEKSGDQDVIESAKYQSAHFWHCDSKLKSLKNSDPSLTSPLQSYR